MRLQSNLLLGGASPCTASSWQLNGGVGESFVDIKYCTRIYVMNTWRELFSLKSRFHQIPSKKRMVGECIPWFFDVTLASSKSLRQIVGAGCDSPKGWASNGIPSLYFRAMPMHTKNSLNHDSSNKQLPLKSHQIPLNPIKSSNPSKSLKRIVPLNPIKTPLKSSLNPIKLSWNHQNHH